MGNLSFEGSARLKPDGMILRSGTVVGMPFHAPAVVEIPDTMPVGPEQIKRIQEILKELGYQVGVVDGVRGGTVTFSV